MIQKKYTFSQSSVKLVISGLPDYSNNDKEDIISIISSWKLLIVNKPEIEGSLDHLKSVIKAFYDYSYFMLFKNDETFQSKLIDIKKESNGIHTITLKSSKQNTKPLLLTLGNAEIADIVNCFDQLYISKNINLDIVGFENNLVNNKFNSISKKLIFNKFIPPLIAIFSVFLSSVLISSVYKLNDTNEESISFLLRNKTSNINSFVITIK